jgi:very-short-patch-repair endonuclease
VETDMPHRQIARKRVNGRVRDKILIERAKEMRREMTGPERRLWYALRAKRLDGAKFRRQVVIDRYIAGFACRIPSMLIVEVDVETHAAREKQDAARTAFLEERGYRVLRFTNDEVMSNLDGVLIVIANALTSPLPDPLP